MKPVRLDGALGLAVVSTFALVVYEAGGAGGVLQVAVLFAGGALALFLWNRSSRTANVVAVVLAPAILLTYLMPKNLRRAIKDIKQTKP
jgi:hypothetical protein